MTDPKKDLEHRLAKQRDEVSNQILNDEFVRAQRDLAYQARRTSKSRTLNRKNRRRFRRKK